MNELQRIGLAILVWFAIIALCGKATNYPKDEGTLNSIRWVSFVLALAFYLLLPR